MAPSRLVFVLAAAALVAALVLAPAPPTAAAPCTNYSARAYHNANQSINNNQVTALALNSERWDSTGSMHDNTTNNSRVVAPVAARYTISGEIAWADAGNTTGRRSIVLQLNGTTSIAVVNAAPVNGNITTVSVSTVYDLAANDYIELQAFQTSGAALNVNAQANHSPELVIVAEYCDPITATPQPTATPQTLVPTATANATIPALVTAVSILSSDNGAQQVAIDGLAIFSNLHSTQISALQTLVPPTPLPTATVNPTIAGNAAAVQTLNAQVATLNALAGASPTPSQTPTITPTPKHRIVMTLAASGAGNEMVYERSITLGQVFEFLSVIALGSVVGLRALYGVTRPEPPGRP